MNFRFVNLQLTLPAGTTHEEATKVEAVLRSVALALQFPATLSFDTMTEVLSTPSTLSGLKDLSGGSQQHNLYTNQSSGNKL